MVKCVDCFDCSNLYCTELCYEYDILLNKLISFGNSIEFQWHFSIRLELQRLLSVTFEIQIRNRLLHIASGSSSQKPFINFNMMKIILSGSSSILYSLIARQGCFSQWNKPKSYIVVPYLFSSLAEDCMIFYSFIYLWLHIIVTGLAMWSLMPSFFTGSKLTKKWFLLELIKANISWIEA